jgi:hypothetical protein
MTIGLLTEDEGKLISVIKALYHDDMGMKVQLQAFLTSVLDGGKWSASSSSFIIRVPFAYKVG